MLLTTKRIFEVSAGLFVAAFGLLLVIAQSYVAFVTIAYRNPLQSNPGAWPQPPLGERIVESLLCWVLVGVGLVILRTGWLAVRRGIRGPDAST